MTEIIEWNPTEELRWFSKHPPYTPKVLERKFICKDSDGMTCEMWTEVHEDNPFVRVEAPK